MAFLVLITGNYNIYMFLYENVVVTIKNPVIKIINISNNKSMNAGEGCMYDIIFIPDDIYDTMTYTLIYIIIITTNTLYGYCINLHNKQNIEQ